MNHPFFLIQILEVGHPTPQVTMMKRGKSVYTIQNVFDLVQALFYICTIINQNPLFDGPLSIIGVKILKT